jgi:hypothetical protein
MNVIATPEGAFVLLWLVVLSDPSSVTFPWRKKGVLMSECLHCDIHEMLEVHLQNEQAESRL